MCIYFKRCGVDGGEVCFQQRKYSNRDCRNINFYKNVEILKIVSIISGPEAVGTAQNRTSVPGGSSSAKSWNRTAVRFRFGSPDSSENR